MAGANTLTFNEATFESEVLASSTPVLVDFWAEWCMPCRNLAPIIDELAADFAGRVKVGKLDTDANQSLAVKYNVMSIPTIVIFKGGKEVKRFIGFKSKREFKEALEAVVAG